MGRRRQKAKSRLSLSKLTYHSATCLGLASTWVPITQLINKDIQKVFVLFCFFFVVVVFWFFFFLSVYLYNEFKISFEKALYEKNSPSGNVLFKINDFRKPSPRVFADLYLTMFDKNKQPSHGLEILWQLTLFAFCCCCFILKKWF